MHNSFSDFSHGFICVSREVRFGTLIGCINDNKTLVKRYSTRAKALSRALLAMRHVSIHFLHVM